MAKIEWVSHRQNGFVADSSTVMGKVIDESQLPQTVVEGKGNRIMQYIGEPPSSKESDRSYLKYGESYWNVSYMRDLISDIYGRYTKNRFREIKFLAPNALGSILWLEIEGVQYILAPVIDPAWLEEYTILDLEENGKEISEVELPEIDESDNKGVLEIVELFEDWENE